MEQQAVVKKPFYKKWWFWVVIVVVGLAFSGSGTKTQPTPIFSIPFLLKSIVFLIHCFSNVSLIIESQSCIEFFAILLF